MASKRTPRSTRSKTQTRAELNDVLSTPQPTPREREQQTADSNSARNATAGVTVETATKKINEANVAINKTLTQVTEQVVAATQQLTDLQRTIKVEEQELENLYSKGILAESLADMIEQYRMKEAELQKNQEALFAQLDEEHAQKVRDHEAEISERITARQRNEEQYNYDTLQRRRQNEDQFQLEMLNKRRTFEAELALKKAEFDAREKELKAREEELMNLRKQVAEFPQVMEKEVNAKVAIATNSLKKDLENRHALESRDMNTQLQLAKQSFDTATATIASQQTTIHTLEQRLAEASSKVENIATKALDAASGRQALAEVQGFVTARNEATGNSKQR